MTQQILGFRLSPLQERLWQRYEHQPSSGYRTEMVIDLKGFVDRFRLVRAVKSTIDRHEILRTRFESLPELTFPLQVVTHPKESIFTVEDLLQNDPTDALGSLAPECGSQTLCRPLTVRLISKGQQTHQLRLSLSPLCGDSKTLTLLAAEIQQAYALNGAIATVTEPLQYADLAEWQHDLLANEQTQQGRDFWRQLDFTPLNGLHLPGDCSSASSPFDVCPVEIDVPPATGQRLQHFAQEVDCSVAAPFLAAWQVLLSRMSGQTTFLLGVGTDGRPYPDLHQTLGLCDQIVPLSCEVSLEETVHTALHRIDRSLQACQGWQGYFDWGSVADLLPHRESEVLHSHIPNLDYCFEWISRPSSLVEAPEKDATLQFVIATLESHSEPFKLKLTVTAWGNTLQPILYFNPHCFDLDTIRQLSARYQTLLQGILEMPDRPVGQVPWLAPADLEVLAGFEPTPEIAALPETIHQYFEAQARQSPQNIALRWDAEHLDMDGITHAAAEMTYAELNARANQLAHYLRSQGVRSGEFIGLCVPRSPVMVIAILGILKAGAAYVPLDATYPLERLTQILHEAALSRLVVCGLEEPLLACLKGESRTLLDLDRIEQELDLQPDTELLCTATGADIAYLIFTSGSTGVPKGVQITHSNLCHYAWAMQRAIGLQPDDVYLHTASIAFSSSVRQLMVPLCLGATVAIATQTQRTDAIALLKAVKAHRVTVVDWVPSLWRHCLQEALALTPEVRKVLLDNDLRLILSASEPLPADLPVRWRTVLNHPARVINMYGQTETCGIVAVYPIPCEGISGIVPLGRPIANTRLRLVDAMGQPVPVGVVGEVQVSGPGVGPGYFQRPDLTARSFCGDLHHSNAGDRWYKTGDLARFRADGTLEFVSRGDRQVKIRGVRVELGEIESVLLQHPQVSEAAVIAVKSEGEALPVGFAILKASGIAERDLMVFLQQRLPRPMMPTRIRILRELPLTPNGKLDRLALQQMALEPDAPQQDWQEVRSPIQELLAGIWCQLLHRDYVGAADDFFALGGHSLLATQLVSRVRAVFAVELPLRTIFEAPTLAALSDRISDLRRQEAPQLLPAIAPVPHTPNATFPLSFAQQQLWVFEQFAPHTSTYHLSRALHLKGHLDVEAIKRSFKALMQRQAILRTRFLVGDSGPVQVIDEQPALPWIEVDLRDSQTLAPQENWQAIAHESLRDWSQKPFDLSVETPLRLVWVRGSETESLLLVTLHHIIADGWSASVFIRELAALYEAERTPNTITSSLPALPFQYVDFALWQRQVLQESALATSLQYWEMQLQQPLPVLNLPTDRPRPQRQTFRGKTAITSLNADRVVALKNFSRHHGVTPFMTLLAAFQVLLWRQTTETDFAIGVPIANRTHPQTEELIGCFTNTLVLRTPLDPARNFLDLLACVRTNTLEAYSHQDLPFEKLVERLQPDRDRSHSPLFQVFFALQNVPTETLTLPGLTLSAYPLESTTARYDLSLTWDEVGSELCARWEYNCDLFNDATVTRWMERYGVLLDEILTDPDRLIHRLPWLSEAERYQVCVAGNQTQVAHSGERHLHRAVEQQVARQPDAIALEMGEHRLTYDALNRRANQIAHALLALGVEGNALVGLCLERSPEMVAAVLGILKAGCAYVPLDPCYPQERLAHILEDAAIQCLVTQSALLDDLPPVTVPILDCTTLGDQDWPDCNLERVVAADALAYVIYTSGSTGQPKGAQILHESVANCLYGFQDLWHLTPQDQWLAVTTLAFDIAVLELFLPLTQGATVILAPSEVTTNGLALHALLQSTNPTVMQATPATWRMLLAAGWQGNPTLQILCGGEALTPDLAQALVDRGRCLWNLYGPTETTIWSLAAQVDAQMLAEADCNGVPIGRPIVNTRTYVLDAYGQPTGLGIPGELYLGGAGLARGYLNRPELTAAAFSTRTGSDGTVERLYRTGDWACYRPDGQLDFCGRRDRQVKLRGHRIELAEIEHALERHPAIAAAVVLVKPDHQGEPCLAAYYTSNPMASEPVQGVAVQTWLRQSIPGYMVPSVMECLEAFPLTPNGKIDRQALRLRPLPAHSIDLGDRLGDSSPMRELLASLWESVLGHAPHSLTADFFAAGGHSLLATQLTTRLQETFGVTLPLQQIFETPTFGDLVVALELALEQGTRANAILPLRPRDTTETEALLPLSFAQQRLWFLDRLHPDRATYNLTAAVRLRGQLNADALEQSLRAVMQRHEALRARFPEVGGQPFQHIDATPSFRLQHWDAAQFQGNDTALQQAFSASALNPFDLSQDVLVRGVLVSTSAEEWVFLLVVHHIVADGWSLGLLIREVAAVYQALLEKTTVESLPSRPLQYGDYVQWQRQWLQGDVLDAKLAYWRTQLANLPVEPVLPPDHPQAAVETAIAATHEFRWSPEIVRVLRDLSRQERVTLFMTLFGLLEVLLYRQTGQTDLPVGTDVANRFPAATEETIGFFVNVLVLRGDISGNPTFRNLLHRVRKMALEAYAHQDVPFDRVVAALNPDRQQQTPLFQLLFVLQNAPMPPLELPGVTLELLEFENPAVRFDIAFFATEIEEGLRWQWRYNAARFDATTIDRLAQAFTALSEALVASPDATIAELIAAIAPQTTATPPRRGIKSLRHIQSKPVEIAAERLTTVHPLFPDRLAPVVFSPALPGVELRGWAASHRPQVEAELARTGAVLFRGFGIDSAPAFEAVAATLCDRLYGEYGDLPRTDWGGKVYGSTPYPADRAILFHSESSHLERWPQKIAFCCLVPAQEGGETPLVDCQEILKHLPPDLRDRFADLGLLYIRNYIPGLDVSWQDFFRTDERHTVEAICRQRGIAWEWLPDGGLQTRQLRPAIACHPRTGALVFFNQIFLHHAACLDPSVRDSLLTLYGSEHRFPRSVCFGDGSPIPDAVVAELSEWYAAEQVSFPWQTGDILLVDNLRMAHGRSPYRGDRRIVVAMGDMMTADVAQPMGGES